MPSDWDKEFALLRGNDLLLDRKGMAGRTTAAQHQRLQMSWMACQGQVNGMEGRANGFPWQQSSEVKMLTEAA